MLHSFGGTNDGIGPFSGAIFDSAGNLFGTTYFSTPGAGIVYELTPPAVCFLKAPNGDWQIAFTIQRGG